MTTQAEIKNTLSFITQVLNLDVLPYFDQNQTSPVDVSAITSSFMTLQQSIITLYSDFNTALDSNILTIDQKIAQFSSNPLSLNLLDYRMITNPTGTINPARGVGAIWVNIVSGVFFVCVKSDTDQNLWVGTDGTWCGYNSRLLFDIFNDASCVALYGFNGDYVDLGGLYPVTLSAGSISYFDDVNFEKVSRLNGSLNIGNNNLAPLANSSYSFSTFFRPDTVGENYIISRDTSQSSPFGFRFSYNSSTKFFFIKFATGASTAVSFYSPAVPIFNDNNLHHCGFSVDRVFGVVKIYCEGKLIYVGSGVPISEYSNGQTLRIGSLLYSATYVYSPLYLRQSRFFNRIVTDEEFLFLSKEGGPL